MKTSKSIRNSAAVLAWLILASACATPMQELVDEAMVTGDWTKVDKREAAVSRRLAKKQSMNCAPDYVGLCTTNGISKESECTCESFSEVRDALDQGQDPGFE